MDTRILVAAAASAAAATAYFILRPTPTSLPYLKHAESSRDRFHVLPDGRRLCYRAYGVSSGRPVLFLHGMPGSRFFFAPDADDVCIKRNLFVVAPDRPGYGMSDINPRGTTLSVADDVADLMRAVRGGDGAGKYGVVGYSNGGPFALALAHRHPDALASCALVCSGSFVDLPGALDELDPTQRSGHRLIRGAMWLVRAMWTLAASSLVVPESYFSGFEASLSPVDREHLKARPEVREFWVDCLVGETFRQGIAGMLHEIPLVMGRTSPTGFGFDVRSVDTSRVPVTTYVATADALVSRAQSEGLRGLLGGARWVEVEGGHVSAMERVFREVY